MGVADPRLRALPDDPDLRGRATADGIVALPSEAALTTWVAHRCHRALDPLFARLWEVCGGAMTVASMWHIVGGAVVGAATQVPLLAGSSEPTSMRRAQAVLDALVGFGLPVRGTTRSRGGKPCLIRAALPIFYSIENEPPDRAGVLRAAVTPGPLEGRAPRYRRGARPPSQMSLVDGAIAVGPILERRVALGRVVTSV